MTRSLPRLLAILLLALLGWFLWFALVPLRPALAGTKTDAVVVLTGGPGRLAHGLEVLQAGQAKRLLVSGVDPVVRPVELAAKTKATLALFECCVDLGKEAVDTRSNAAETAAWVRANRYRSLRLVTSADHMRRATLELRTELGGDAVIVPDPVASDPKASALAREFSKYALRRAAVLFGR